MRENKPPLSREDRLAAKLRENLRRRKVQVREQGLAEGGTDDEPEQPEAN